MAGLLRLREDELKSLVAKTFGIADVVRDSLQPFARKVVAAFIYGSVARGEHDASSDVDLLVVGDIAPSRLAPMQLKLGRVLGRRISVVVYDAAEFRKHIAEREHFIVNLMTQPRIWLLGTEEDFAAWYGNATRQSRRRKAA